MHIQVARVAGVTVIVENAADREGIPGMSFHRRVHMPRTHRPGIRAATGEKSRGRPRDEAQDDATHGTLETT